MIPYGRQHIDDDDIQAVVEVLHSTWLTTGPKVKEFEEAFARHTGTKHAVAVSNGTAALHAAMYALNIGPGDEVIVPAITFVATANAVVYQGATPVFADVDPENLLINTERIEEWITSKTRAIIAVDYAGHPCNYDELRDITKRHDLYLVDDACHALGGSYRGRPVGSLADLNTFSLHPVKPITTGEGGVITTDNEEYATRMRLFRNHGITTDHRQREAVGSWFYEMTDLGYNYRLTDFQCALGLSQLNKLAGWVIRRQEVAARYDAAFTDMPSVRPLTVRPYVGHAYHLYVVRLSGIDRETVFSGLRADGIGVNVHYIPVHLHPFYQKRFGTYAGMCLAAETAYEEIISLPMFPGMSDDMVDRVIDTMKKVIHGSKG
jgi:perosamine synthetase